jgi:hypothetical protein
MVVALLLARADAVGLGGVEEVARSIGAAYEATAAHGHDGVVIGVVGVAAAAREAAGDVGVR